MTVTKHVDTFEVATTIHNGPGNDQTTTVARTVSNLLTTDLTKGGPIKDYRLKISNGDYAGSKLSLLVTQFSSVKLHAEGHRTMSAPSLPGSWRRSVGMSQVLPAIQDPGTPSSAKADIAALTSLTKKLSTELTTFQGGVFVGELKETIHLLRHPLQGLRSALSKHLELVAKRARRIRKVKNMRDMVTSTWLETSYGIRPLVADIDNGADALSSFINDPKSREFKTLTAQGADEKCKDKLLTNFGFDQGVYFVVRAQGFRRRTATVRYLACIGVVPSVRSCALQKVGLNFASFVPTLWELIPYSFVVDYFTNVGEIFSGLANLVADVRWVIRWSVDEDLEEAPSFFLAPVQDPTYSAGQTCSGGYFSVVTRNIFRDKYLGSLIPPFRWELPGEKSLKWANLAALGVQLASTRRSVQAPRRANLTLLRKGTF